MNGDTQENKAAQASGASSNGDSVAAKKRKKDGLKPIVTTESPDQLKPE